MAYIGDNPKHKSTKYTPQSADPSNPVEGQVQYADGTARVQGLWQFNGTVWEQVGNQGGSLDLILVENFDGGTNAAAFTTGQSAVFGASGTVGGTLADVESGQIQGRRSMKFTTSTTANDWFHVDAVAMGEKQHGKFVSVSIYAKWNGTLDEMKLKAFDVDNAAELDSVSIDTSNVLKRYTVSFWVPTDCDSVKIGFQHLGTTASEVLEFDDLMVTQNAIATLEVPNIEDWNDFTPTASAGFGTISNASGKWRRVGDSMEVRGFFTTGTAAASIAEINMPSGYTIDVTKLNTTASRAFVGHFHRVDSGTSFFTGTGGAVIHPDIANADRVLIGGDASSNTAIRSDNGNSVVSTGESAVFKFTVPILGWESSTETQVVSNASASNTEMTLDTGNGLCTTSTVRRHTNVTYTTGSAVSRTDGASDAYIEIVEDGVYHLSAYDDFNDPNTNGQIAITKNSAGTGDPNGSGSDETNTKPESISTANRLSVQFREVNSGGATSFMSCATSRALVKGDRIRVQLGSAYDSASADASFSVVKTGTTQVTGVPFPQTAYIREEQTSGTEGGATVATTWTKRTLNTMDGDTGFVSLASSVITLSAGTYDVTANAPHHACNDHKIRLRNTTDSTSDIVGSSASDGTVGVSGSSLLQGRLTLTASKSFELQYHTDAVRATDGLGKASSASEVEVYSQVKITKIK